jgi:hypothetical protein
MVRTGWLCAVNPAFPRKSSVGQVNVPGGGATRMLNMTARVPRSQRSAEGWGAVTSIEVTPSVAVQVGPAQGPETMLAWGAPTTNPSGMVMCASLALEEFGRFVIATV